MLRNNFQRGAGESPDPVVYFWKILDNFRADAAIIEGTFFVFSRASGRILDVANP